MCFAAARRGNKASHGTTAPFLGGAITKPGPETPQDGAIAHHLFVEPPAPKSQVLAVSWGNGGATSAATGRSPARGGQHQTTPAKCSYTACDSLTESRAHCGPHPPPPPPPPPKGDIDKTDDDGVCVPRPSSADVGIMPYAIGLGSMGICNDALELGRGMMRPHTKGQ
ncbi:hypothetical protein IF2G_04377 [Cordyceps javanica]|nr:hypothetical protein IF2G_04377 [Cordyceps javanica]